MEGEFEMPRLKPGDYTMIINGTAEVQDCNSRITLHGGKTGTFRATLPPRPKGRSHSARAICQDENGIPLSGVLVMFSGVNLNAVPVRSGDGGVAIVEGLPVPACTAMGNLEGYFPGLGQFTQEAGEVPETLITMRRMLTIEVAVFDAATGEALPRYNVHVHTEVAMAGDECGTTPRGIRGKGVMNRGKLVAVPGPCKVMVEAPGYEGVEREVDVPAEGMHGPVRVTLESRKR